ncbi:MAG: FAD-dependent oxidoreductase [Candidatus Omnitrophota bacterium]
MNKIRLVVISLLCGCFSYSYFTIHSQAESDAKPIVWLEAECFSDSYGGWSIDAQFADEMGSPYLLADGVDAPVEDAAATANIPSDGEYRLWARCKDWLPPHSPGQFQILVNGKTSSVVFGKAVSNEWRWADGGLIPLKKGNASIKLHDLTGWWGRCDAVVLSAAKDFKPSDDPAILMQQRRRYFEPIGDVSPRKETYDIVVVGGGLAGSASAISAARHGASVALIQDRPVLGGNASSEIDVPPGGDNSKEPFDPMETGIIEEFYGKTDRGFDHDWSAAILKVVAGEPNIDLYFETRALSVQMKDEKNIKSVIALDIKTGQQMVFPAKLFIDCTGDGWIGFYAGAQFRKGQEARSEFAESLAPEEADEKTMGNTLMVAEFAEGEPSSFQNPAWAYEWKSLDDFQKDGFHFNLDEAKYPSNYWQEASYNSAADAPGFFGTEYAVKQPEKNAGDVAVMPLPIPLPHFNNFAKGMGYYPRTANGGFFEWWVEYGGMKNTIADAEEIRDELFRINLGLWNFVKNYSPEHKEKNKNRKLTYINYVAGKRESRRLLGDYILTQWDYESRIDHPDNVAYGGWGIDVHHSHGFWTDGPMYYSAYRDRKVSIPYRCLYSRNIDNLFLAGRDISVSHVALGGVRVMRTTSLMGQAVGTAAALCVEKSMTPRQAGKDAIGEIQQRLLKDGAYIMGVKNEDSRDLALKASVTASSVKTIPDPAQSAKLDTPLIHDLNMPRAVMFKAPSDKIEQISLRLISNNDSAVPITLWLRSADAFKDFSSQNDLAKAEAIIAPKSDDWVTFKFDCAVEKGHYYYAFLLPAAGLQWRLFPALVDGACRAYGGPSWTVRDECYVFSLAPQPPADDFNIPQIALAPENVIDGWNRAVHGTPHSWGPNPAEMEPWIELNFGKPITFNSVHVTFQNIPLSCSQFRIEAADKDGWKTLTAVKDNEKRRCVFTFAPVQSDRLRLVLQAPSIGDPKDSAQVCEIRVYNEGAKQ